MAVRNQVLLYNNFKDVNILSIPVVNLDSPTCSVTQVIPPWPKPRDKTNEPPDPDPDPEPSPPPTPPPVHLRPYHNKDSFARYGGHIVN